MGLRGWGWALAGAASLICAACDGASGSGGGGSGGATNGATSSTGSSGSALCSGSDFTNVAGDCDLLAQNCPEGEWCDVVPDGIDGFKTACVGSAGTKAKAESCASAAECAAGLICVGGACTPFCCPGDGEPCDGGTCDVKLSFGDAGAYAMVCSYADGCELFAGDCPEGEHCHISDAVSGLAVCDSPSAGFAMEGEPCEYRNDCGESQLCNMNAGDAGVCRHLCDTTKTDAEPGEGGCLPERTCQPVGGAAGFPNLGICMPAM